MTILMIKTLSITIHIFKALSMTILIIKTLSITIHIFKAFSMTILIIKALRIMTLSITSLIIKAQR